MVRLVQNRKALIAVAAVVAFLAIVVPTCQMVNCSMGAMPWGPQSVPGFFGSCGGMYVINQVPNAVVPPTAEAIVLVLLATLLLAQILLGPQVTFQTIEAHDSDPPPDPLDSRGERLRL